MYKTILLLGTLLLAVFMLVGLMTGLDHAAAAPTLTTSCVTIATNITADTTWNGDCYLVTTDTVAIMPGVTLSITPPISGTQVRFSPGAQMQVLGTLHALGAATRAITFTSAAASPAPGDWIGIIIEDDTQPDQDIIRYTSIEYARTGVKINDEDGVEITHSLFRYNGGPGSRDGAISGDTDNSTISHNVFHDCRNGLSLNEAFNNVISHNTLYNIAEHGIHFAAVTTVGGSQNQLVQNQIHSVGRNGIRLELGTRNEVLSNSLYLNDHDSAIVLWRQDLGTLRDNLILGSGPAAQGAVVVTATSTIAVERNIILDQHSDALVFDATSMPFPVLATQGNALCALEGYALRNAGGSMTAPANWWGTNVPTTAIFGPVHASTPITLGLAAEVAALPADGVSSTALTVTFRAPDGTLVPTLPPGAPAFAPNPRAVTLTTSLGTLNTPQVVINAQGEAGFTLTAAPTVGTAIVTATGFCGYPVTATVTFTATDVAISKTTAITEVALGERITYTLSYTNLGGALANQVVLTDTLPAGTQYLADNSGLQVTVLPGGVRWALPNLPPAATGSFTLVMGVEQTAALCNTTLVNTATLHTATADSNLSNNLAAAPPVTVTCPGYVDLVVIKDDNVGPSTPFLAAETPLARWLHSARPATLHREYVYEGDVVTYTIALFNNGPETATNIVLTETLPLHATYLERGFGWATADGRIYTLTVPSLPPGSGFLTYMIVRVNDPIPEGVKNLINQVCTFAAEPEANPADNCNYEDTPVVRRALRISKSAPMCIAPGDVFYYTPRYTNTSTLISYSHVPLTDTLPAEVTYAGSPVGPWSCTLGQCTTSIPAIPANTTATGPVLSVRLSPTYPITGAGYITNTIEISGGHRFTLVSVVDFGPDLVVVKNDNVGPTPRAVTFLRQQIERQLYGAPRAQLTAQRDYVRPGDIISYTILYVNSGVATATDVVLTEQLPAYTRYIGGNWVSTGGGRYTLDVGTLAPGMGGEAVFIVQVIEDFPLGVDRVFNQVNIAGAEVECDMSNNVSYDDTPVRTNTRIYVAARDSDTVEVFSASNFTALGSIPAGPMPFGMAAWGGRLYVANFEDSIFTSTVSSFDLTTHAPANTVEVGRHPTYMAALDGRIYVANHSGGEGITVIDHATGAVVARLSPDQFGIYDFGFFGVAADTTRNRIYATKRYMGGMGLWVITPTGSGYTFEQAVSTGQDAPYAVAYNPNTDRVYVAFAQLNELRVYDAATLTQIAVYPTGIQDPNDPGYGGQGLAVLGQCAYISNYVEGSLTVLAEGPCGEAPHPATEPSLPAGAHQVYLPLVLRGVQAYPYLRTVPLNGHPKGLAAQGGIVLVTLPNENRVAVLDAQTLILIREIETAGEHPHTVLIAEP